MKKMKPMTLSQQRKLLAKTGFPMVALMLMLGFQNCSPGVVKSTYVASDGSGNNGNGTLDLDADTKPVTVTNSETLLVSMQQQTGLPTLSTRTLGVANDAKTKVSESGRADSVNAPMWMAVTNLAGEVCLDLIDDERAKAVGARRYFGQVDFTRSPASISSSTKDDLIRRMARNFWGRNETTAERTLIRSTLDAAMSEPRANGATDATETENALLFACTAMLSSLDTLKF